MSFEFILEEVHQLQNVSDRLESLASQNPLVEKALLTVCGNIRNTATFLEVLVAVKMANPEQRADQKALLAEAVAAGLGQDNLHEVKERSTPPVQ